MKQILSGALRPGDRLVELRIAAELNTSQAPVREAVRELEAMGLVETRHNKGARVRVISDDEIREIYDVRAQLEAYASECVAKAGIDLRSKLEKQMEQMRKAAMPRIRFCLRSTTCAFTASSWKRRATTRCCRCGRG